MITEPKKNDSTFRWWVETIIKLLAAGAGIVAILSLFSKHASQQKSNSPPTSAVDSLTSAAQYAPPAARDFVGLKIAQTKTTWENHSAEIPRLLALFDSDEDGAQMQRRYYVHECLKTAELFFWCPFAKMVNEEPTFDVTFVNNTGADLTITGAGVALDSGQEQTYTAGEPAPAPIPIVANLVVDIPLHLKEHSPSGFPAEHNQPLDTPQFLTPGTAFRYTIRLNNYVRNLPEAVIMRLTLTTSRGTVHSKRIYMQM